MGKKVSALFALGLLTSLALVGRNVATGTGSEESETIPSEMRKFYKELNAEEKEALIDYAKKIRDGTANFSLTDNAFLDTIKAQSERLFLKMTGLRDMINAKLEGLKPESRKFIEDVIRKFIAVFAEGDFMHILLSLKNFGKEVMDLYDRLPRETKYDLTVAFPTIESIATSDVFRFVVNKISDYSPDLSPAGSKPSSPVNQPTAKERPKQEEDTSEHDFARTQTTLYPSVEPSGMDTVEEPATIKLLDKKLRSRQI